MGHARKLPALMGIALVANAPSSAFGTFSPTKSVGEKALDWEGVVRIKILEEKRLFDRGRCDGDPHCVTRCVSCAI